MHEGRAPCGGALNLALVRSRAKKIKVKPLEPKVA